MLPVIGLCTDKQPVERFSDDLWLFQTHHVPATGDGNEFGVRQKRGQLL